MSQPVYVVISMIAMLMMATAESCIFHEEGVALLQFQPQLVRDSPVKLELVNDGDDKATQNEEATHNHVEYARLEEAKPVALSTSVYLEGDDLGKCIHFPPVLVYAAMSSACLAMIWLIAGSIWVAVRGTNDHDLSSGTSDDRITFLDNAKFVAMVLVVFGHVQAASTPLGATTLMFVMFHLRIFSFVSGLVSKDALNLNKLIKLVIRLAVPYIFYCVLIDPLIAMAQDPTIRFWPHVLGNLNLHNDHIGWYLLALLGWRLAGSLLLPFHGGIRFALAMVFSYAGNHYVQTHLPLGLGPGWNRIASLFPVFVAGQMLPVAWLSELPPVGCTSVILGILLVALCFYVQSSQIFTGFFSQIPLYGEMTIIPGCGKWDLLLWTPCLFRNVFELSKGLVILLCFCPRSRCIMSEWGENSIYPFLLHRMVIFHRWQYMLPPATFCQQSFLGLGLLTYSAFCTALLATRPVRMVFGILLEPLWLEGLLGLRKKAAPHEAVNS